MPEPIAADAAPAAVPDALLAAVCELTRLQGRERSAAALLAGQPLAGQLLPDQAVRALNEAGFHAALAQRRLDELPALLLPVVLLLEGGDACVLTRRDAARCEILVPCAGAGADSGIGKPASAHAVALAELDARYTGFALMATPQVETRAPRDAALRDPGSHWLWGTLRRFIPCYRSALLAALLSNVLMLVSGIVMSVAYDKVIPHQAFATLWALASGAGIALLFDLLARQLRSHLIDTAGRRADLLIGAILFRQTLGVRMEHRPASAGSYAHHLAQVEVVRDFFTSATLSALSDLPFIALFVAMIFFVGGPLGWVLVLTIPLILGLAAAIQRSLRRSMGASMAHQADLQGVLVEAVEGLEDLKAAGAQGRFLHRYEAATAAAAEAALRARALGALTTNISSAAQQAVTLVMLVWGVYLIHAGSITGGALIGSIMFASRAIAPLGSVVNLATRYQGARAAMVSLDRLMSLPTEREPGRTYVQRHAVSGRIGLHDVSFAYPDPEQGVGPKVLKAINLRFEPGERVAILGRIGSGKSTVLRLLAGLYQPSEGRVETDGIDLRQIDPADFRTGIGFVSQDPRLFHGSLRENVLLGRTAVDAAQLVHVARITGLDRLVAGHPKGWDLSVGEMGGLLSGGQRQLVALARCLVTQPQILLMDEPTSSMDAQSEILFLRQLKEAVGPRTLVMVTHRPAVLELVDRIVVVDGGKVVLDGPKAQVLAALSGTRPAVQPATDANPAPANLHRHPVTQPLQQAASV
jgi:ATP-binding cassette subfamily C protein LapB